MPTPTVHSVSKESEKASITMSVRLGYEYIPLPSVQMAARAEQCYANCLSCVGCAQCTYVNAIGLSHFFRVYVSGLGSFEWVPVYFFVAYDSRFYQL